MSIEPTSDVKVDVLAGHLGHLTEAQQQAFAAFRKNLAEARLYAPAEEEGPTAPSHDEPTLLYVAFVQLRLNVCMNSDPVLLIDVSYEPGGSIPRKPRSSSPTPRHGEPSTTSRRCLRHFR